MRTHGTLRLLPLVGVLAFAACDGGQSTDPFSEEALAEEDRIALSVLEDPASVEAALALADVPLAGSMGGRMGMGVRSGALGDAAQARLRFQEARQALAQGDLEAAAELAREARRLVARAALAAGGRGAAGAMVERTRGLGLAVGQASGDYVDAQGLQGELDRLHERARLRLHAGDSLEAAQRCILAEQRYRQRTRDLALQPGGPVIAVDLADAAVTLATRLVEEAGAAEEQTELLALAADYAATARSTLDSGVWRMVGQLASLAQWTAYRAVVGTDGTSDEEAQAMLALAEELYAQAAALEELTDVEAAVLERAAGRIEAGTAALAEASPHGAPMLWRAAVACAWILA